MARALADAELPKAVAPAMTGGIAELAAGWILEGRAAQLPELSAPLIEVLLTPSLGVAAAVRAADAVLRDDQADERLDDRRRMIDAFAEAVARDGLAAVRLSDVAQAEGIELDAANALFTDELDCATKALDEWASQLVIISAGAFLAAAGDPPLAAHRALEAALGHIARTPAVAALAVSDDQRLATAVTALRQRYIALFFQLVAGQVPAAEQQRAPAARRAGAVARRPAGDAAPLRPAGPDRRAAARAAGAEPAGVDAVLRRRRSASRGRAVGRRLGLALSDRSPRRSGAVDVPRWRARCVT